MILDKSRQISVLHGTICDIRQDIQHIEQMLKVMLGGAGELRLRINVTDGNEVLTKKKKRVSLPFMEEYEDMVDGYVEEEYLKEYKYDDEPNEEFSIHLLRGLLEYKKYREDYYTKQLKELL